MGYQPALSEPTALIADSSLRLESVPCTPLPPPRPSREEVLSRFEDVFCETTAVCEQQVKTAFRLRYQVYCVERNYEESAGAAAGLECDSYDDYSHHILLTERTGGEAIGTVRLVQPGPDRDWLQCLPLASYAHETSLNELAALPAGSTAEVSRFAIPRAARDLLRPTPADADARPELLLPYISLGLIRGLVRQSMERGITHWCLAAEPSLLRRLRGYGLHFQSIGPLVEHRGLRQVCCAALAPLMKRVQEEQPAFWRILTDEGRFDPADWDGQAAA